MSLTTVCRLLGGPRFCAKIMTWESSHQSLFPWHLPPVSLPPLVSHSQLPHPQETLPTPALPRPIGRSGPDPCVVTALCWVPVHEILCASSESRGSVFHSSGAPACKPAGLQCQILWNSSSCGQTSAWRAQHGAQNSLLCGEPLSYDYFPVCGLLIQWVWDLIMSRKCPSYHLV